MSKWVETDAQGNKKEEVADMSQCKWLMNEVCCNADSEHVADFPREGDCNLCPYFTKEDGEAN